MKITVLCVGKLKEKYWQDAVLEYSKRLSAFCKLEIIEVPDEKTPDNASPQEELNIKQKEGTRLLAKISERDFVVALDLQGTHLTSEGLSSYLDKQMVGGVSSFVFLIGGSLGLSQDVLARANYRFCASKLTFPHQLMRVIFVEQIYRSFKIMQGGSYHK